MALHGWAVILRFAAPGRTIEASTERAVLTVREADELPARFVEAASPTFALGNGSDR